MKTLLSFLIALFIFTSCEDQKVEDTDVPKFDTSTIKKNDTTQVVSLFAAPAPEAASKIVNPYDMVCGDLAPYSDSIKFAGNLYGFCGQTCLKKFAKKPSDYLK